MSTVQQLTSEQPIPDVLDAAARTIEGNGLHRGDWWPYAYVGDWQRGEACCTAGSIAVALGHTTNAALGQHVVDIDHDRWHPAVQAMLDHLGFARPEQLFAWSDEQAAAGHAWVVVEALRACAAQLRAAVTA